MKEFLGSPRKAFIDGKWVAAKSGKTFEVFNPATGSVIGHAAACEKADVDEAVKAARKAFDTGPWTKMTPSERGRIIWKVGDLILKYTEELAQLESIDNGKPISIARAADVVLAADIFHYMAGWATKIEGSSLSLSVPYTPGVEYQAFTRKEPVGVVAQIIPWNFPLLMAAWKLYLHSIHASHRQTQALQPPPPRTHSALPNRGRALRELAGAGLRGSI